MHQHQVYDTDNHFVIDPITKEIINQSEKMKLMLGDHNSERFTFEIPRYIDGHDMTLCDKIEIHYINIDSKTKESNKDVYIVDDMQLSPNGEDVVIFSWLISGNATQLAGTLNFRATFKCISEPSIIDYQMSTEIFKGITVSDGISNSEAVIEQYSDVLEQWKQELNLAGEYAQQIQQNASEIDELQAGLSESRDYVNEIINYEINWNDGGYISKDDGNVHDETGSSYSDYVTVMPGTKLIITNTMTENNEWNAFYDANKTFLSPFSNATGEVVVPDGAVKMRLSKYSTATITIASNIKSYIDDSIENVEANAKLTDDAIAELKGDLEAENGKRAKPIKSLKNITIEGYAYNIDVPTVANHRYVLVCTPTIGGPFTLGNLVSGTLPELVDGVTYAATLTASQDGSLRLFNDASIDVKELYVFDTTNNDDLHNFVLNALFLAPNLFYDVKNGYRNVINISKTDSEYDLFFKFLIGSKVGKCDLVFDGGTFNLQTVYEYMHDIFKYTFRNELPIGNDCRYFFNGATLIGTLPDASYSDFTSLMGSKFNKGSYEMYDGILIANGMVYTVHDEMTGQDEYTHKYSNMVIKYNSGETTNVIRKCIGGGAGRYGNIVLEKCVLVSDYSHELSFHGYENAIGNVDGALTLNISNTYFEHGIQTDTLPTLEKGTIIYCSNNHRSDYANFENDNWTNYVWNNVTH